MSESQIKNSESDRVANFSVGQSYSSNMILGRRSALVIRTSRAGSFVWAVCRGPQAIYHSSVLATVMNKIAAGVELLSFERAIYQRYVHSNDRKVSVSVGAPVINSFNS